MDKDAKKSLITRISNKIYVSIVQPLNEKEFKGSNSQTLRYMFFPYKKSDVLVIGFSACNSAGPRYNYVKTISDSGVNRLFVKDDFGPNRLGDYYLGCQGTYSVEKATYELIEKYRKKTNAKKLVFIGSSKGGYAALNFGVSYPNSNIIIAAPQYYLGTYMDNEVLQSNLEDILGEKVNNTNREMLDLRLKRKIETDINACGQVVYIHYSDEEHTYEQHIKDLLNDLQRAGIKVYTDVEKYAVHGELKYYFPHYLSQTIQKIKNE